MGKFCDKDIREKKWTVSLIGTDYKCNVDIKAAIFRAISSRECVTKCAFS